jgi:hypothetical protein
MLCKKRKKEKEIGFIFSVVRPNIKAISQIRGSHKPRYLFFCHSELLVFILKVTRQLLRLQSSRGNRVERDNREFL